MFLSGLELLQYEKPCSTTVTTAHQCHDYLAIGNKSVPDASSAESTADA